MSFAISIIIPAYNAERTLSESLQSIYASFNCDRDEVIVVDDASTDRTREIASLYNCKIITLKENAGPANARNQGAKIAQNEIILFIDSDVLVSKKNLEMVREYFAHHSDVHTITASVEANTQKAGFLSDFKNLYMNYTLSKSGKNVNYVYGSFCTTRKKGFIPWPDKVRVTEDSLWGFDQTKLGLTIHCLSDLQVTHLKEYSFLSLVRNDFVISSHFAYSFLKNSRWKTLYTKEAFGHTSKAQQLSVLMACLSLTSILDFSLGMFFLFFWFVLNWNFFSFLMTKRNSVFTLKSFVWYYFVYLVYASGIFYGSLRFLRALKKDAVIERETA